MKGQVLFKGEIITKKVKIWVGSFKNILFKNQWVRKAEISMKEFLRSTDTSLKQKNHGPQGSDGAHR